MTSSEDLLSGPSASQCSVGGPSPSWHGLAAAARLRGREGEQAVAWASAEARGRGIVGTGRERDWTPIVRCHFLRITEVGSAGSGIWREGVAGFDRRPEGFFRTIMLSNKIIQ